MSNLKQRIEGLVSSTNSLEAKDICNEALKQFSEYATFNLTAVASEQVDAAIAESIISKLDGIQESEVSNFLTIEKRLHGMNNLGVKKALGSLDESEVAKHATFKYVVEKLKAFNNAPEWAVIENVISVLDPYKWDPTVKENLAVLETNFKKYEEDIKIYKAVDAAKNSRSNFVYSGVEKVVENYLNYRTAANRTALLESLNKYVYDVNIKNLYNVVLESDRSFQLKAGSNDAFIGKIYSPIIVQENSEIFAVHGKAYAKTGSNIRPLDENEIKALPASFTFISKYLTQPNVEISENKMKIFSKDKKVELIEEADGLGIFINNKKVTLNEFHTVYLNSGIFRFEEKDVISAVNTIVESWDSIFELDFVKSLFPKGIPSRRADVFKLNEKTFINTVDAIMNEEKFYSDCNATQSRNLVLEFAKYDLGNAYTDFLKVEEKELKELETKQSEIFEAIEYLESKRTQLTSITDEAIRESDEVKSLVEAIDEEIATVKNSYYDVKNKINNLTYVAEGASVGDEVEFEKKKQ